MEVQINNLNKIKDEEQRRALNTWVKETNCRGSIIAGTGFGKSRTRQMMLWKHTFEM